MKQPDGQTVALALTWDGARRPLHTLPAKGRAFLARKSSKVSSLTPQKLTKLFARDVVREIRICWVPKIQGGGATLAEPLTFPGNKRMAFRVVRTVALQDHLGVIYRRWNGDQ